ncbi:MAG: 4Fe-4S dicluster domain-containing protein, partial [Maritimibacter sp.]
ACKETNNLEMDVPRVWQKNDGLSSENWTSIIQKPGKHYVRKQCRHCLEPACVSVCPVGALHKTNQGAVIYDSDKCLGCRYCMMACPIKARSFVHAPLHDQKANAPRGQGTVEACNLCAPRIDRGRIPACVEACEAAGHSAILFGDLNDPDSALSRRIRDYSTTKLRADLNLDPGVRYQNL